MGPDFLVGIPAIGRIVKIYDLAATQIFHGPADARLSGDDVRQPYADDGAKWPSLLEPLPDRCFSVFRVLKCDSRNGHCSFAVGIVSSFRGGTPFVRYATTDYFASFARTMQERSCGRAYRPHFVVLPAPKAGANSSDLEYVNMDVGYISGPLEFARVPLSRPFAYETHFCDPFGLPCGFLRRELGNELEHD
ncbi:hypothetical protein RI367_008611 [Sorochytrium milnesiophthora]